MKTSVIIPVFNRAAFVADALRSLLRQRGDADLDIIVVDDGSTDGSADIVAAAAAAAPQVRLIRQPNAGVSVARNTGLANLHPDSELVAFLDSDDISVAGRFAAEVPLFAADPALDLTYSLMTLTDAIDSDSLLPIRPERSCTLRGISLATALFRRRVIATLGGLDPALRYSEDLDYLLRAFEAQPNYQLVDNVSFLYRRHTGNATRDKAEARRGFLKVMLMTANRRRRNPAAGAVPKFFDLAALQDEAYAALR